ncbi:MAG: Rieske (2Fe-2S) protein [Flavobacteriales bacterium]|nr:Rieske (2Fe-2S) protein [Flavobacteriales bacterium]MBV6463298.1 3-phenylpropionate/cinnamic acid dioxygenase ferredoxin subunit [Chlorobiota bacterium]MBW7853007.1 Rieske (2Fe-2S) protein [Candidatus Kapabacteria bacterium]MCC6331504.1 Rieske (2Fe-2S) protein [Ignavibacteria bacterium]MBZ0195371.1 Rieske (2Fe-2S) protein [Candidatus Kapabacteria bacterium]
MPDPILRIINGKLHRQLCRISEIPEKSGKHIYIDFERDLALFKVNGTICAVTNVCPHQHFPTISKGVVENGTVTCPMHGWCFDLRSGRNTGSGGSLMTYQVVEFNGFVWIEELL